MVNKKNGDKPRRRRGRKVEDGPVKGKSKASIKEVTGFSADEFKFRPHKSLLIHLTEETPTWYECGRHTPGRDDTIFSDPPPSLDRQSSLLVSQYRILADSIYKVEVQLFSAGGNGQASSSDDQWVETTMKRGTLKDRIAAMSVVVSTNPVHKLYALDGLLQLAGCSETNPGQASSRVAQMAAEALSDLFLNTLLPSNRKLFTLDQRPLYRYSSSSSSENNKNSKKTLSPRILLLWRYEEMIKQKYQLFVRHYLTHTLREGMEIQKVFCLRTAGTLLRSLPEGEAQLLSIMVNKLGDPAKKIAAAAGHELRRVLAQHSNMQLVVAREVQQLSHRPHLSPRALYNCIIFLNQLKLFREEELYEKKGSRRNDEDSDEDDELPKKASRKPSTNLPASLINTYFRLFEVAVHKTKKESNNSSASGMKSRLLSALLTGVNRAHPYLPAKDKHMEEHIDALYRIVHTAPPSACTQALMLLFHLAVGPEYEESPIVAHGTKATNAESARQDRFYRALYAALSQTSLLSSGKHLTMFFNLVYKAMKYDTDSARVVAMAKRLLCTTLNCNSPMLAASLFLLSEVMKYHPVLKSTLEDIAKGDEAKAMLDPTKREPRAALVCLNSSEEKTKSIVGESLKSTPLWEVALIAHHFHPSVSKFATSLGEISYTGDPLRDFSLAPFLDKFAYRNPKSAKSVAQHWKRGESVAERKSGTEGEIEALMSLPVNDPAFIEKQSFNEQEEFFRKFFVERARRDEIKGIVRGKGATADSGDDENEERRALDEAETMEVDHDFDADYDTDSEEEAFVNSLAEKLMASSANGKVNFDDEDPDMEGWSDLDDDVDENSDDEQVEGVKIGEGANHGDTGDLEIDDDAFMDSSDDESESESNEDSDSDAGDSADLALVSGSSSDSDEEDDNNGSKQVKKSLPSTSFADASEYEAVIAKSWNERKRPKQVVEDAEEGIENETGACKAEGSRKRRKRTKKGRKV